LPLLNVFRELKTVEDYRKRLNAELLKNGHDVNVRFPDGYQEAPLAYDAVWAVALGKNESLIN
jgi:gamma-aminobutyric acid type B receptor